MSVFVAESHPSVPGANARQALLERGAELERQRIVALFESEEWDAPEIAEPYVRHIIGLIKGEES